MDQRIALITALLLGAAMPSPSRSQGEDADGSLFIIANTQFTLCHEIGHALFSELNVADFGSEEDAVDQLAAICFLRPKEPTQNDPLAAEKLLAVADAWRLEWALTDDPPAYWDVHSLDIQRFYNVLCLIYGSDPDKFHALPEQSGLPWQRAWSCEEHEYRRAVEALRELVRTRGYPDGSSKVPTGSAVRVEYEVATSARKEWLASMIKASGLLENKANLLNRVFPLPRVITIVMTNCLGDATATWRSDRQEIAFCYELLEHFAYLQEHRGCLAHADKAHSTAAEIRACLSSTEASR